MTDITSRIEALKKENFALHQKIIKAQMSKRDSTLAAMKQQKGIEVAPIRLPKKTKLRRTLKGHFGKVMDFHWGGDSRILVSASQDGNLLVWNAVTSNKIQSIPLKSAYVMAVGIEQTKGNMIACGGLDNLCTVYNRTKGTDQAIEMASHDGFLTCCRFLSEDKILTSSGDSTIIHWDIASGGRPLDTLAEHKADAMCIAQKPDDNRVFATCSVDKTTKIWDIRAPTNSVKTFYGHGADVNGVDFMPTDGNCFATCSQDNSVLVYDLRAYNQVHRFGAPPVLDILSYNPYDDEANEAQLQQDLGQQLGDDGQPAGGGFTSISFSRSGRAIFCGHADGSIIAYDLLSDKTVPVFSFMQGHEKTVSSVAVSPAGDALCSSSWDATLKIWA